MSEIVLLETFDGSAPDPRLRWYCPPERWSLLNSCLVLEPDAKTDYWQKTHYGFQVDNGHFLYLEMEGDFCLSTKVRFFPVCQYDQAGLMVRFSPDYWIKTSVEYEPHEFSRLGSVVTNHGYSDWATQNFPAGQNELEFRIKREGDDYILSYREPDGEKSWVQMRIAHLHNPAEGPIQCGVYACSPIGAGFKAAYDYLKVEQE